LDPVSLSLHIGDTQHMVLESTDDRPFYLNQKEERLHCCHNHDTGRVSISKPKISMMQLLEDLERTHITK